MLLMLEWLLFLLLPTQHPPLSLLPQQQLEHYSEMLVFITAKRSECGGGFNDFSLSALSVAIRWTRTRSQFGKSGSVGGGKCVSIEDRARSQKLMNWENLNLAGGAVSTQHGQCQRTKGTCVWTLDTQRGRKWKCQAKREVIAQT